jgi:mersacidin/lichenicidin family type 2 lantibiotic
MVMREDRVRARKVEDYRHRLSPQRRARIPADPAGLVELADDETMQVAGGLPEGTNMTAIAVISADRRYVQTAEKAIRAGGRAIPIVGATG